MPQDSSHSPYGVTLATWAIEAAHIEPYSDKQANEISNGLLLRCDLHALFDAHLLSINPTSRVFEFSEEAFSFSGYEALHGKVKLPTPQPGFEDKVPTKAGLQTHWAKFKKNQD